METNPYVHRTRFNHIHETTSFSRRNIVQSYLIGHGIETQRMDKTMLWLPYDDESSWLMKVTANKFPGHLTPGQLLAPLEEAGGHGLLFRATDREIDKCQVTLRMGDLAPLLAYQTEKRA